MFTRKRPESPKRRQYDLRQLCLTDIPDDFDANAGYGNDDDAADNDLEAELVAITGGDSKPKLKAKSKTQLLTRSELDKMIEDSLRDVSDDDDYEALENDTDLLGELRGIAGIDEELRPEPKLNAAPEQPIQPMCAATAPPTPSSPAALRETPSTLPAPANPLVSEMRSRQAEYKADAVQAKRSGDTTAALQFLRVVKQFDLVVKMCEDGQAVDLSDMPPPPGEYLAFMAQMQQGAAPASAPTLTTVAAPNSMLEALQQRLA